jgi:hypothetical protein
MRLRQVRRPSPSLVVATAALFAAVGGQAWATSGTPAATSPKPNVYVKESTWKLSNGGVTLAKATCRPGTRVLGGGYASTGQHARFNVVGPSGSTNSFLAYANMPPVNIQTGVGRETAEIKVIALCARAGEPVVFAERK